jgi:pilus assembly protein CpaB
MVSPESLAEPGRVDVPAGLQEITVLLSPERVVGGDLVAGDTVGIVMSNEAKETHLRLQNVLVTALKGLTSTPGGDADGAESVPVTAIQVSLAVSGPDAELIVNAVEFGSIWLTKQHADTDPNNVRIVSPGTLLQ